jgi:hypothetical protein
MGTSLVWEHDSIEKYVVVMGRLLNDIRVNISNKDRGVTETLLVPVTYGPREKVLAAANRPSIDEEDDSRVAKIALTLPRIAFECTGLLYDPGRQTPATNKLGLNQGSYLYNPPAWNFTFNVSVLAKTSRTANRIIEQIVSRFVPSLTLTVKPLKDHPEYSRDVIVELQGVQPDNQYEGDFLERQTIVWNLQFVVKGWLFGPITDQQSITRVEVNFVDKGDDNKIESAAITPGLTSSGEPTSNASLTIDRNSIASTDNYDYITDYTDYYE